MPGRPPGIPNKGNTCFAARTLQLIANSPLADHLPHLVRTDTEEDQANQKLLANVLATYKSEKERGVYESSIRFRIYAFSSLNPKGIMGQSPNKTRMNYSWGFPVLFLGISGKNEI